MQRLTCQSLRRTLPRQPFTRQSLLRQPAGGFAVSPPTATTSQSPGRLARLADFAFRRRRLVLAAWIAAFVVALGAASQLGGDYHADYSTPGSESKAAEQRLADRFPQQTPFTVDVVWQAKDASSAAV